MDYYTVLDVPKTSTQDDIKKAYRKMAMKHHPDRNGGDETHFKKVQEAYDVLNHPAKRQQYDNPTSQFGFGASGIDMNDFFSQAFGQRTRSNTQTLRTTVSVPLVTAFTGGQQVMHLQTSSNIKVITIDIPKGVATGDTLRYDNVLENAVLLVQFAVLPDSRYNRRGNDLCSEHSLSVLDLIVGTKFKFQIIDGKVLEVKVPPKTQPSSQLRIPKAGMPSKTGDRGDQIILIKGIIPDIIDNEIIDSITKHQNTN